MMVTVSDDTPTRTPSRTLSGLGVLVFVALLVHLGAIVDQPVLTVLIGYAPARWLGWNLGIRGAIATALAALIGLGVAAGIHPETLTASNAISAVATVILLGILSGARAEDRLTEQRLLETDALTRLPNRAHFERELSRLKHFAEKHQFSLIVTCLDCDNFKEFNDTHGHRAGDEFLLAVTETLQQSTTFPNLTGRLGGDEFACVWPGKDISESDARSLCASLKQELASATVDRFPGITWSLGAAVFPNPAQERAETMLDRADELLLSAKRSGKNTVAVQIFSGDT